MRYLITGHTGFKGSWLSLLLSIQGHKVSGISLKPENKSLYNQADLHDIFDRDLRCDIRNANEIKKIIELVDPEVIIHLAAQPLVNESYKYPIKTFESNVLGTLNVLESTRALKNLKATLVVTTDKVYKNYNPTGCMEDDELGGIDPYSASKAAADIATQSWAKCFGTSPIAIARAGNVIGGGDWAIDRIDPEVITSFRKEEMPALRSPESVRPWQHVFDCLSGYLQLIDFQLQTGNGGEWNFGPKAGDFFTVANLVDKLANEFGKPKNFWTTAMSSNVETLYLRLNSEKARKNLHWHEKLSFEEAVNLTASWYKQKQSDLRNFSEIQIGEYLNLQTSEIFSN